MVTRNDKEIDKKLKEERKKLLELLLEKTGLNYKELVDYQVGVWVASNTDLITEQEKQQFKYLVF
ncbi:MAG: hypothetical protein E7068_02410 [Lentimicrobiaceae bacterium]|nr:hypothetical protein [Lentimicrobiaceae bacterium]